MSEAPAAVVDKGRHVPRWMGIVLIVSVSVNLLVVGLMAGAAWIHRQGGPFAASVNPLMFIRSLPKERREAIRQAGRGELMAARPLWQEAREARREVDKTLLSDPFDANAFAEAQRRMLDKEHEARRALVPLFTNAAGKMTLDERRQMVRWRDRHRERRRDFTPSASDDDGPRERGR